MSLSKKQKNKVNTVYTGKITFYHNNGVSAMTEEGTFEDDKVKWLRDHIGRDAIWQNKNFSINLKYFSSVEFSFKEAE